MPNTAGQVLIQIAADPSNAETQISAFQSKFSHSLSNLGLNLSEWSAKGQASFKSASGGLDAFSSNSSKQFGMLGTMMTRHRAAVSEWSKSVSTSFRDVQASATNSLESGLLRSFLGLDTALARNISNAKSWQKNIGAAFAQAAERTIAAIAQEAIVRAIYSTALGFLLLAEMDFSGATQAFTSAAEFAAVGGAATIAAHALAGSAGSGTSRSSSQAAHASHAAHHAGSSASARQSGTVQVIFQGPVYGGQAGIDELTRKISQAVVERDVNLTAYTTVRQPVTRA